MTQEPSEGGVWGKSTVSNALLPWWPLKNNNPLLIGLQGVGALSGVTVMRGGDTQRSSDRCRFFLTQRIESKGPEMGVK